MGSEDLFQKRKARASAALKRQKHTRARNKRYLIVCEGAKTEPNYFYELLNHLRILPQVVRIAKYDGSSPDRVVANALKLFKLEAKAGDTFDQVYCVFDRDTHTTFNGAVKRIKDLQASGRPFVAITSTPCFEVWLLLHFSYTDQPYHAAGKKSVGDQVVSALMTKPGFASYGKGQKGIYARLADRLDDALSNAERLRNHGVATGSDNPATDVDLLVNAIQALAAKGHW